MDETLVKHRWKYLALGTVAMLFMGAIYAWSILKMPLGETFGWTAGQLSLNYSVCFCSFCVGNLLGSSIIKKIGVRGTILIGSLLLGAGYLSVSFLQAPPIILLYLCYGLPIGGGTGIAYPAILAWVSAWFPDRRGTCSGILMMGFGFSALILGNIMAWMIRTPAVGWRFAYRLLGICIMAALLLCAALFKTEPPVWKPENTRDSMQSATREFTPREMIKTATFWKFYLYGILAAALGSCVFSFAYEFCLSLGATAALAASMVGLLSAANGSSRMVFGVLYDKLGHKRTIFFGSLLSVIASVTLFAAAVTGILALGAVGMLLAGLAYGYGPVLSAALTQSFYGTRNFASNYSINNTKVILCSFYSPLATALLTLTGSFVAPFGMVVCLSGGAFAMGFTLRKPK